MELLDIRDAVNAIIKMIKSNSKDWKPVYNLGSGQVISLIEIAHKVRQIASSYNGGKKVVIELKDRENKMNFGMNSSLFYNDMQWQPEYDLDKTVVSLSEYFMLEIESPLKC